jgi:hypothetical protein
MEIFPWGCSVNNTSLFQIKDDTLPYRSGTELYNRRCQIKEY